MNKMMNMVCKEFDNIAEKGSLTAANIEMVYKLIMMKEKLLRIEELEGKLGYSQDGEWAAKGRYARSGYPMDPYMMRGDSYAMEPYDQRRRYSMDEGRSMIEDRLADMMNDPNITQQERTAIRRAMDSIR